MLTEKPRLASNEANADVIRQTIHKARLNVERIITGSVNFSQNDLNQRSIRNSAVSINEGSLSSTADPLDN